MDYIDNLFYTKEHIWIKPYQQNEYLLGITNFAQESLGDIVFVELPVIGKLVQAGDQVGVIESVKAASEIYSPVSGKIREVNNELINTPQLVNTDPENSGWYIKINIENFDELNNLLSFDQYKKII